MKAFVACMLTAGLALSTATAANAAQGCGPGGHRGPRGHCRGEGRPLIVGHFYHGQGYWDGYRYRPHRYRYHNGWRYR